MKILIDADACPKSVLQICMEFGRRYNIPAWTVASFNHDIVSDHPIAVGNDFQEADMKIMNLTEAGDIVVTGDWGLAAMVLGKGAACLSPMGREFRTEKIEFLLEEREAKAKFRRGGGRTKGPKKRKLEDDRRFESCLEKILLRKKMGQGMNSLNVCVIGVGGVGGYFGGKLAHTFSSKPDSSASIFFVARGKHLEAIKKSGLILKSPEFGSMICRPVLATDRIDDLPPIHIFLICVKGYDLMAVATSIRDRIRQDTMMIAPLNGADIQERLRGKIKTGMILHSCVYVSSYIEEPGVVVHIGNPGRVIFGKDPDHPDYIPHEIFGLFEKSSIAYEWKEDANPAIWEKYMFIASFGLVSARYYRTLGEILEEPSLKREVIWIMNEIYSIALKKAIRLPDGIVELSLKKATMFSPDTQTSLQRDIHQKRGKSELELLGGTIIDLGKELGISTPTTQKIYRELEGG
jgi:2-dehydropantoate 2-reductase